MFVVAMGIYFSEFSDLGEEKSLHNDEITPRLSTSVFLSPFNEIEPHLLGILEIEFPCSQKA